MESLHSIIVPVRDRNRQLALCLWSLMHSAQTTGNAPWELVVVDGGSEVVAEGWEHVKVITTTPDNPFNKSRLLNIGIEAARGDLITFLDADAIVGPLFMSAAREAFAGDNTLTKVCYRVWNVSEQSVVQHDDFPHGKIAFEAYGLPHKGNCPKPKMRPIFGNSQQSIRRDTLGDCRFDEAYVGRGFEDIDFNAALWEKHGSSYNALMITDPSRAMCHIANGQFDGHWGSRHYNLENRRRYFGKWTKKLWNKRRSRMLRH